MNRFGWTRRACLVISALALSGLVFACGGEPTETEEDVEFHGNDRGGAHARAGRRWRLLPHYLQPRLMQCLRRQRAEGAVPLLGRNASLRNLAIVPASAVMGSRGAPRLHHRRRKHITTPCAGSRTAT